jgi:hypothetical protein
MALLIIAARLRVLLIAIAMAVARSDVVLQVAQLHTIPAGKPLSAFEAQNADGSQKDPPTWAFPAKVLKFPAGRLPKRRKAPIRRKMSHLILGSAS